MNLDRTESPAALPPGSECQVWLDFDGTLTRQDVLDVLISRYAVDESWKAIERRWQRGEIGSRECLGAQIDLVRVTPAELEALLDSIALDPGVAALVQLLESCGTPAVILSDSVDFFIQRVLARHGLGHLAVRSNGAQFHNNRLKLQFPHENPRCSFGAAHCKCASMDALRRGGRRSIYVGDGRSDLCAARKADFVFAKGALAQCLDEESLPYVRYSTLRDVAGYLANAWQAAPTPGATGAPTDSGFRDVRAVV